MAGLDQLKAGVVLLVLIALIGGALAIGLDEFQDDIGADVCAKRTDAITSYNDSGNKWCYNATHDAHPGTDSFNATEEGLESVSNATSYLSTIGTLLGVAALIGIVVGAFYFAGRRM